MRMPVPQSTDPEPGLAAQTWDGRRCSGRTLRCGWPRQEPERAFLHAVPHGCADPPRPEREPTLGYLRTAGVLSLGSSWGKRARQLQTEETLRLGSPSVLHLKCVAWVINHRFACTGSTCLIRTKCVFFKKLWGDLVIAHRRGSGTTNQTSQVYQSLFYTTRLPR